MPTVQVKPSSLELLQHVADSLGKARKVVIITGAGISTNSGIPDFRSENGLYSLIQAQFERAEANQIKDVDGQTTDFPLSGRPSKRRRISQPADESTGQESFTDPAYASDGYRKQDMTKVLVDTSHAGIEGNVRRHAETPTRIESSLQRITRSQTAVRPSLPRNVTQSSAQSSTSHESLFSVSAHLSSASSQAASPETDDSAACSTKTRHDNQTRSATPRASSSTAFSSSPLSSPPPILFDPYDNTNSCTDSSSQGTTETSDSSDSEDAQNSLDIFSSQTCNTSLRNMKGRDLFDSNIWADPLKTSVFYRFATTLRQKVKEVEPTVTHRFIAQLRDVGKLARVYTQNIDEIEKKIGLSTDLKNGAGNKRRKSAKQQIIDPEKDTNDLKEHREPAKGEDDLITDAVQSSQSSETSGRNTSRPVHVQDKGVECVFLHGSLHALRCFVCGKLCDWDEDGRESCTMSGEQPECPHCAGATAARQERGKRALGVGKLRPDIVLYGEEHPQSDLISPIVQHDLSAGPDLLLILGTSLRVHGLKVMVKEFAKAVHNKGGKVLFINLTKPSESAWGDMIDYWIEWDCDAWVDDLKNRKPHLWLSPDEILEVERQKREALAEKKRETMSKKRESLVERKRESVGEKRRHTIGADKPRPPPKNPSSMRNDYQCGAYVVWEIFQTLAKIGNRPFDNLGHDPPSLPPPAAPPPVSSRPTLPDLPGTGSAISERRRAVRTKKARKSAPATISHTSTQSDTTSNPPVRGKFVTNAKSRNQYTKAAQELARTGKPPTPVRLAELNRVPTPQGGDATLPYEAPSSITAAVKLHPRQRKRKIIEDIPGGKPAPPVKKLPAPRPRDRGETAPAQRLAVSTTCDAFSSQGPVLPPIHPGWERSPPAKIAPLEPNLDISPRSPLADLPPVVRPQVFNIRQTTHPMIFSDPLSKLRYDTTNYRKPLGEADAAVYEKAPSPSDQLRWELAQQEALEGAQALEGLRYAR
ncbi:DHS-like NAD/FAD-binding domain-containing protein [Hypoxylon sp. FL1150]|nr:DHS-like NAD/FAD-binding domain-containing protein [Hypoxylon sp. FL1150]